MKRMDLRYPLSFTTDYNVRAHMLVNEVIISKAFDLDTTNDPPKPNKYTAIWDTGATGTVVSNKVINECDLKPIGLTIVNTAGGSAKSGVYLINIGLPNMVQIPYVRVTEGILGADIDVL